jgi:hypothetical protein
MKTYYAIVNVGHRRLGTFVPAENVAAAFKRATARYKTRYPRLHVETIAVQEMADEYADPTATDTTAIPYLAITRGWTANHAPVSP